MVASARVSKLERRQVGHFGLWAVVACGILSRLVYRGLGVRFSAAPLDYYIQFLDPELLRHDLLRSLFYMRDQPPGFNGFLGLVLKLFPVDFAAAYGAITSSSASPSASRSISCSYASACACGSPRSSL